MNRRGDGDGESDEPGKIFVGGLTYDTTTADMKDYFLQYGEIVDSHVMMDNNTNRSRCFGFITFKDPASCELVFSNKPHVLKNKTIDCKVCNKKAAAAQRAKKDQLGDKNTKVFVGGLPATCDEEGLKTFFSEFGEVTEAVIVIDPDTKRPRGFGFVTFESDESVEKVVNLHYHNLQGKQVECKSAQPRMPGLGRSAPNAQQQQQQQQWPPPSAYPQQDGWGGYGQQPGYGMPYGGGMGYGQPGYPQPGYGQAPAGYGQAPGYDQTVAQYGQQPPAYGGGPGYDYANMGGGYAQQQSSYGPDRSAAYAGQAPAYGAAQPNSYGSGYADPSYPSAGSGYAPTSSAGGSRGYHPYGR